MIISFFAKLRENVNPDDISTHLFANDMITKSEKAELDNVTLTQQGRMDKLLAAVQRAISINPQMYETFLDILDQNARYSTLVKEMRGKVSF